MAISTSLYQASRTAAKVLDSLSHLSVREELYRAVGSTLELVKAYAPTYFPVRGDKLIKSLSDTTDVIMIAWLIQYIPYFNQVKGNEAVKYKVRQYTQSMSGHTNLMFEKFEDRQRVRRTAFEYDCEVRPLRAFTHVSFFAACAQGTAELFWNLCLTESSRIGVRNFFGQALMNKGAFLLSKTSSLVLAGAYAAWALDSVRYLQTMPQDRSRTPAKEIFKVVTRVSLAAYHALRFFGASSKIILGSLAIIAGVSGVIGVNVLRFNQDRKGAAREAILANLRTLPRQNQA